MEVLPELREQCHCARYWNPGSQSRRTGCPQCRLSAPPSLPQDDLIPREDACATPRHRQRTACYCQGRGRLSHSAQRESGHLGTGLGGRPQETPAGSQLLSNQQRAGHQATRGRKEICMRPSF